LTSLYRSGRGIIAPLLILATTLGTLLGAAAALTATVASAQNLDAGKSPEKLFADGCTTCHRSPRGLAKGRISLTLAWFLQDHYAAGPDSAKALAAYLASLDEPPRAAAKPAAKPSRSKPRPPQPVQSQ
jgi:hypothetical protein